MKFRVKKAAKDLPGKPRVAAAARAAAMALVILVEVTMVDLFSDFHAKRKGRDKQWATEFRAAFNDAGAAGNGPHDGTARAWRSCAHTVREWPPLLPALMDRARLPGGEEGSTNVTNVTGARWRHWSQSSDALKKHLHPAGAQPGRAPAGDGEMVAAHAARCWPCTLRATLIPCPGAAPAEPAAWALGAVCPHGGGCLGGGGACRGLARRASR